jgi:hypothetical protein
MKTNRFQGFENLDVDFLIFKKKLAGSFIRFSFNSIDPDEFI